MSEILIDTHVHFLPSTEAAVDWGEIDLYIRVAKVRAIDMLCITEHRHATEYEELLDGLFLTPGLAGRLVRSGVFRCDNGVVLTAGAEIAISGGGDVGIHAEPSVLLRLSPAKGDYSANEVLNEVAAG